MCEARGRHPLPKGIGRTNDGSKRRCECKIQTLSDLIRAQKKDYEMTSNLSKWIKIWGKEKRDLEEDR